jgi:adenosine kinase
MYAQTVILNISAAFLPMFFKDQIKAVLPYVSIVLGNEDEGAAFAKAFLPASSPFKDLETSLPTLAACATSRPVTVVITQGSDPTLVVEAGKGELQQYPVLKVAAEDIVDTNGAGDAFAGGLIGALVAGKTLKDAIVVAQRMGKMNLGQVRCPLVLSMIETSD